jgi:hypothetical protein
VRDPGYEAAEYRSILTIMVTQATRLDESIRDHAAGARMFMKQQAFEELTAAQRVQADVEGKTIQSTSTSGACLLC